LVNTRGPLSMPEGHFVPSAHHSSKNGVLIIAQHSKGAHYFHRVVV